MRGNSGTVSEEKTALIGGYRNCSCSLYAHENPLYIERFYMDAAGFIRNQDQQIIAEIISDFREYIMEKEYDYHPEIRDDAMRAMRNAGWYEGRKINLQEHFSETGVLKKNAACGETKEGADNEKDDRYHLRGKPDPDGRCVPG